MCVSAELLYTSIIKQTLFQTTFRSFTQKESLWLNDFYDEHCILNFENNSKVRNDICLFRALRKTYLITKDRSQQIMSFICFCNTYLVYGIIRLIFETSYTKFVSYTDVMFVLSLIGLIFYMYLWFVWIYLFSKILNPILFDMSKHLFYLF